MKRAPTLVVTFLLLIVALLIFLVLTSAKKKEIVISDRLGGSPLKTSLGLAEARSNEVGADVDKAGSDDDKASPDMNKAGNDVDKAAAVTIPSSSAPVRPENNGVDSIVNPGCKAKTLPAYKAIDVGKVYEYPSLVHYAKLGYSTMQLNFREYTSVMAAYKFLRPEKIIFHTYSGLTGLYWEKIKAWKDVKIEVNKIPRINTIGGKHVVWVQHQADYVKLSMVYKYGGTAMDFDVIIINGTRLKREQRLSECVLAEEHEFINGGFYSCTKNATFMADWLESYEKDYRPNLWLHNVSYRPLNLLTDKESKCYNVHLDDTLCLFPSWSMNRDWLKQNGVKWRTKTAAHYFVKNGIPNDGEGLLKEKFSLAEMIQYVHNA